MTTRVSAATAVALSLDAPHDPKGLMQPADPTGTRRINPGPRWGNTRCPRYTSRLFGFVAQQHADSLAAHAEDAGDIGVRHALGEQRVRERTAQRRRGGPETLLVAGDGVHDVR